MAIWPGTAVNDRDWLVDTLATLERSMGGDGNGYTNMKTGVTLKGLGVATSTIATLALSEEGMQVFHSRYATVGGSVSELNHPFDVGEHGVLVHNGGWFGYDSFSESDYEFSDTATAAALVRKHGPGVLASETMRFSGVWVIVPKGGGDPLVFHNGQHEFFVFSLGKAATQGREGSNWMAASELPDKGVVKSTKLANGVWSIDATTGEVKESDIAPVEVEEDKRRAWTGWSRHKAKSTEARGSAGKVVMAQNGMWVPCIDCGAYDLVSFEVDAMKWTCTDCLEWYTDTKGSYDHHIGKYARGATKEAAEIDAEMESFGWSEIHNYDSGGVDLPALRDQGVDVEVGDLFPEFDKFDRFDGGKGLDNRRASQ